MKHPRCDRNSNPEIELYRSGYVEGYFLLTKKHLNDSMKLKGLSLEQKGIKSQIAKRLGRDPAQATRAMINDYKTERGHLAGGLGFLICVSTDYGIELQWPIPKLLRLMGVWNVLSPNNRIPAYQLYYLLLRAGSEYDSVMSRNGSDAITHEQVIFPKLQKLSEHFPGGRPEKLPTELWKEYSLSLRRALTVADPSFNGQDYKIKMMADELAETMASHFGVISAIAHEWMGSRAVRHRREKDSFGILTKDWNTLFWRVAAAVMISLATMTVHDSERTENATIPSKELVSAPMPETIQIFRTTGEEGAEKHTEPGTFQALVGKPSPETCTVDYVVPDGFEPAHVDVAIHGDGRENRWEWTKHARLDEKGRKIHSLKLRVRASTTDGGRVTVLKAYAKRIESTKTVVDKSVWSNLLGFFW